MKKIPTINIHSKKNSIMLSQGKYHIDIIGGFLIKKTKFKIKILRVSDKSLVPIKIVRFGYQGFESGKRTKRYYEFYIKKTDNYLLEFINPEKLIVKRSNVLFFPFNFFNKIIPNKKIEIKIEIKSKW
jgi:hypothetical protein